MPLAAPWTVRVEARLPDGRVKAAWSGVPLTRRGPVRVFAARWARQPVQAGPLAFAPGDVLVEWLSAEAWFNAFRVHAPGGRLKGWYVNLVRPHPALGLPEDERLAYTDLGLDLIVTPGGCALLDEPAAEAALAALPAEAAARARREAERLRALAAAGPRAALAWLEGLLETGMGPGEVWAPELAARWGPPEVACFARIALDDAAEPGGGAGWHRMQRDGRRVAEAIAVALRGEHLLLHRKAAYPDGVLRLPGGGVPADERPDAAALRELAEETGLEGAVRRWLAYACWEIELPGGTRFAMPNYVFLIEPEPDRSPVPSTEEGIVELPWLPWTELPRVAAALRALDGSWAAWGLYRAVPHELAWAALAGASP